MKKKYLAVLSLVLVFVLSFNSAMAGKSFVGAILFNRNRSIALWADVKLDGRTATFKAGIKGKNAGEFREADAQNDPVYIVYGIKDAKGNILKSEKVYIYYKTQQDFTITYDKKADKKTPVYCAFIELHNDIYTHYIECKR